MNLNRQFYVLLGEQQRGPLSEQELRDLRYAGTVTAKTLCWEQGTPDWVTLDQLQGLSGYKTQPAPPPRSAPTHSVSYPSQTPKYRSEAIGVALLAIPAAEVLLVWGLGVNGIVLSIVGVVATATLAGIEASRLGMGTEDDRTPRGRRRMEPWRWVFYMLAVWAIYYPTYLYQRRLYAARNLLLPGVAVTVILLTALFFQPEELPRVDAPEVIATAENVLKNNGFYGTFTISSPVEVRYERSKQRRIGRAFVRTDQETEVPIYYSVEWHDAKTGQYIVNVAQTESGLE